MNWKKIVGVILLIPPCLFGLLVIGSIIFSAFQGMMNDYPDSFYVVGFFLVLVVCAWGGIKLFKSKDKKKRKSKKKKTPWGKKQYFGLIFVIVILGISLFNLFNALDLQQGGKNNFKQVEDRLFEESLQKVRGVFVYSNDTNEKGNKINYEVVDKDRLKSLDSEIENLTQEREALALSIIEDLDMAFGESVAYSMEKSRDVDLNTSMKFNDLYSYYISNKRAISLFKCNRR